MLLISFFRFDFLILVIDSLWISFYRYKKVAIFIVLHEVTLE